MTIEEELAQETNIALHQIAVVRDFAGQGPAVYKPLWDAIHKTIDELRFASVTKPTNWPKDLR